MSTTNPEYGGNLKLKIGGTEITNLTSHNVNKERATRNVTTRDSGDNQEVRPTIKSRDIGFEGLISKDATYGYDEIDDAWRAGTLVTWREGSGVTGEPYETGTGYITSLQKEAPFDDNVTFSGTLQVTGDTTKGTEA